MSNVEPATRSDAIVAAANETADAMRALCTRLSERGEPMPASELDQVVGAWRSIVDDLPQAVHLAGSELFDRHTGFELRHDTRPFAVDDAVTETVEQMTSAARRLAGVGGVGSVHNALGEFSDPGTARPS